jgi:hypothetical protein
VGEEQGGFNGMFERLQETKRGGRLKKETRLRGDVDCRPYHPLATLAARSAHAIPTRPRGEGARERCSTIVSIN